MRRNKLSNTVIAETFIKNACSVKKTVEALGLRRRQTFYDWRKRDPKLEQALRDAEEGLLDDAEDKLHEAIRKGNMTAIIFYLKTKGRSRGYIDDPHPADVRQDVRIYVGDDYDPKEHDDEKQ